MQRRPLKTVIHTSEYFTFTCFVIWRQCITLGTRTAEWSEEVLAKMRAKSWNSWALIQIWITAQFTIKCKDKKQTKKGNELSKRVSINYNYTKRNYIRKTSLPWQYWVDGSSTSPSRHGSEDDAKTNKPMKYKVTKKTGWREREHIEKH